MASRRARFDRIGDGQRRHQRAIHRQQHRRLARQSPAPSSSGLERRRALPPRRHARPAAGARRAGSRVPRHAPPRRRRESPGSASSARRASCRAPVRPRRWPAPGDVPRRSRRSPPAAAALARVNGASGASATSRQFRLAAGDRAGLVEHDACAPAPAAPGSRRP